MKCRFARYNEIQNVIIFVLQKVKVCIERQPLFKPRLSHFLATGVVSTLSTTILSQGYPPALNSLVTV